MKGLVATAGCLLVLAVVLVVAAKGNVAQDTKVRVTSGVSPRSLPRDGLTPVRLRIGVTSEPAAGAPVPELRRILLLIGRSLVIDGSEIPSCPIGDLYRVREPCPRSIVGRGAVTTEVAPKGGEPVLTNGRLVAYFNQTHRQPRVLARVKTGSPLSLVYVIPFSIKPGPSPGPFGTELIVSKMQRIVGKCTAEHPNCLAQPYDLKGAYARISKLTMTLGRAAGPGSRRPPFVAAHCPAPPGHGKVSVLLASGELTYADGSEANAAFAETCHVAG